ncbi:MAG: hypothetical protein QM760_02770 [Nibricoccus sp.]
MKTPLVLFSCLAALVLARTSTVESRIEEKSHVFNTLSPDAQAHIKQGLVDIGYTQDMVYMAMGKADRVTERANEGGTETVVLTTAIIRSTKARRFANTRGWCITTSASRRIGDDERCVDAFSDHAEEVARVVFKDGKVVSVEQMKS